MSYTIINIRAREFVLLMAALWLGCLWASATNHRDNDRFPDGTPIDAWFSKSAITPLEQLGQQFVLTDYAVVSDSVKVQTAAIQHVVDTAAAWLLKPERTQGERAVVVVPEGVFVSGALHMRPGVSLYIAEGGRLCGSTDISDFPPCTTRIEGQTCTYFPALINANHCDRLVISGRGTIDGRGLPYWKAFWLRRQWNPQCTNKDEQRPRLVYVAHSSNVEISGLTLRDSPFWTCHLYKSNHVLLNHLRILSPASPVRAPSTDAVDIDACHDIHITNSHFEVNDDAVALKGGKGIDAWDDADNGSNERILIDDCTYGFCHSVLTCGSEALLCRNVLVRRVSVDGAARLLHLKMRPDTRQRYEYISIDRAVGRVTHLIFVRPWTQFADLGSRGEIQTSTADHISIRGCRLDCQYTNSIETSNQYSLTNLDISDNDLNVQFDGFVDTTQDGDVKK